VSFEIRFEGSMRVGRSQMRREGISKRRADMSKTTKGESIGDTMLMHGIERGRVKLKRWSVEM